MTKRSDLEGSSRNYDLALKRCRVIGEEKRLSTRTETRCVHPDNLHGVVGCLRCGKLEEVEGRVETDIRDSKEVEVFRQRLALLVSVNLPRKSTFRK